MYQNGLVVTIKINGKTVEEKDCKVVIPFNSEYSLMLKNRNDRKAVARIYIDGEEVTKKGSLIIDANGSINVERFIDDMDRGKKFKFVPISDSRVDDKGDSEKGFVEVRFQLVKPVLNNFIIHEEHIHHKHHHYDYDWYFCKPYYVDHITPFDVPVYGSPHIYCNSSPTISKGFGGSTMTSNITSDVTSNVRDEAFIQDNHLIEERGATIKGSNSSQKFCYSYVGELEAQETVIRFQLIGSRDLRIINQYVKTHCTQCGKAYDINDNYCAKCGTKK